MFDKHNDSSEFRSDFLDSLKRHFVYVFFGEAETDMEARSFDDIM